jgi:hypothetical protein
MTTVQITLGTNEIALSRRIDRALRKQGRRLCRARPSTEEAARFGRSGYYVREADGSATGAPSLVALARALLGGGDR